MKSKLAKIIDATLGAAILFFAAYAIMRYYLPNDIAVFSAASTALSVAFLFGMTGKKKDAQYRLTAAAENMFYDFMFLGDGAPIALLAKGLRSRGEAPTVHGNGLYLGKTAAYAVFDKPLDAPTCAKLVARAKHYGANRIVLLLKTPPSATVDVSGVKLDTAIGDDVYKLFASLRVLPPHKFDRTKKPRFHAFRGALDRDKTLRYLILAASLFGVSAVSGFNPVAAVCAATACALFVASVIYNIVKASKRSAH